TVVGDQYLVLDGGELVLLSLQVALRELVLCIIRALVANVALEKFLVQGHRLHVLALVEIFVGALEHRLRRGRNLRDAARARAQQQPEQHPDQPALHFRPASCSASMRVRALSTICPESPRSFRMTSR